jgi:hypothetical protein
MMVKHVNFISALVLLGLLSSTVISTAQEASPVESNSRQAFLPAVLKTGYDWPQLGNSPQRTNYTDLQVDPPYCYTWKWYEASMASRAQPVISAGRLFIGDMEGVLHARSAATGAPVWRFASNGPIRHSAAVLGNTVIFGSHDGMTYGLNVADGALKWKIFTGPSSTAPLVHSSKSWVYVASSNGVLTALDALMGSKIWEFDSGAPILTSPTLSMNEKTVFLGNEAIWAIAVDAATGAERWRTKLEGQSLADRYPVVAGNEVIYRSQPLYYFHHLLAEGDDVMDRAGSIADEWAADWAKVRPQITEYLDNEPSKQTFFVLDAETGSRKGTAPVLYTYGHNDIPNVPVVSGDDVYLTFRARRGIQNDSGTVHVTTRYDAELGQIDLTTLDIEGLRSNKLLKGAPEFRMTSDEQAMLSMGGSILWVDSWERLGGINVKTGTLIEMGAVSNDWPECTADCGPGTGNPFFPLTGSGLAYPFPSPRVTEGAHRGGVVVANGMLYWRVIEAGLAGISHRSGSSCPPPLVWTEGSNYSTSVDENTRAEATESNYRSLQDYVTLDLTFPANNPPDALVNRLMNEVQAVLLTKDHLVPFYLERGFSNPVIWPYTTANPCSPNPCLPTISYRSHGNLYWHDPGELLYTMASAYPYLTPELQSKVREYISEEIERYSPLKNLPYKDSQSDWLGGGISRESYDVPFRRDLNSWPPPAAHISTLYAVWLWSKNSGDWSFAQQQWSGIKELFYAQKDSISYYADIAGMIGYARMAKQLGYEQEYNQGIQAAVRGMTEGLNFDIFAQRAEGQYKDPRGKTTGWYAPVFYGMTPEVGLYLREQIGSLAASYLDSKITGDGLRWWYLTRAGFHAEEGETSYIAPPAAWSHFLAQAYIIGESRDNLIRWLDRPWGTGDLYSIQKVVAAIQAK